MKKNRLLSLTLIVCNIFKFIFILFIAMMTVVLVHWHFSPETYKNVHITTDKTSNAVYTFADSYSLVEPDATDKKIDTNNKESIRLNQLNHASLYIYYLQALGLSVFWLLIIQEIKRIVRSVKGLQTFRSSNSKAFKNIGLYCLGIALLSAFKWVGLDGYSFFGIYFQFTSLTFALGAFILAEIFKEGNKLYEAEQLTI
jgi:hypothetical protein